ncbi:hypothetical protein BD769DRAFT_1646209 [Suillus cothurnatus]|nr:hypothetical protein BD769DRAFT_1646209 [Suillus cothurnatus]
MSADNIAAIPPSGYTDFLNTRINSQQFFSPPFDSSASHQTFMSLQSILEQDNLFYRQSDNGAVVAQLKRQLAEQQHAVASLQADLLRVMNENASLTLTCQTLQNVIVNMRGSASSVASSSSSLSLSDNTCDEQKPSLLDGMIEEDCDHELDRNNYQLVKSWTKKEWLEHYPATTSAIPGSSSCRGSGRMARGINVSCTYLQDEKGVPVSAERARVIRQIMLSSFRQLETRGLAPELIGQASLDVLKWLIHTLRKHSIEFRLCADNWKIMKLMTDNYSQWYNYHVKKKASKRIMKAKSEDVTSISTTRKRSSSETEDSDDIKDTTTQKRTRIDSDMDELEASPPSSEEEILLASPTSPSCHDTPLDREPTPPPRTDKGKEKEVIMVEVIDPLSNLVLKPRPKPIQKTIPTPPVDTSTSEINSNPTTSLTDTSTSEININSNPATPLIDTSTSEINSNVTEVLSDNTTPSSIPSSTHTASLAVKVELVNCPKTTIAIDAKPDTIKKRQPSTKPMRVSTKITARNLCALNWQSNGHQKEPASVFASYWNGLSKADKEVYKCKADAQVSATHHILSHTTLTVLFYSSNQLESVLLATMWSSGWRDWWD